MTNLKVELTSLDKKVINVLNLKKNNAIRKNIKNLNNTETLPIVSVPLVVYIQSKTSQNNLDKNLAEEAIKKSTNRCAADPITDRTKTNIEILKKSGLNETEAKKHINAQGYMDKEGKEICRNQGKTGFKGSSEEDSVSIHDSDFTEADIENVDVSMPEELQEFYETPLDDSSDYFLTSIKEYAPNMFEYADETFSTLKSFIKSITSWLE